jgi:ankyrin repeat protein
MIKVILHALVLITLFCSTIRTMQELSTNKPLLAQITQHLGKCGHIHNINRLLLKYAKSDNVQAIDTCLKNGARIDTSDQNGNTALHIATEHNCIKTIEHLLSKKADVNAQNNQGYTPLMRAIGSGLNDNVFILLHMGNADVNLGDKKGRTPLYHAIGMKVILKVNIPMVTSLLQAGANPFATYKGKTPLDSLEVEYIRSDLVSSRKEIAEKFQKLYELLLRYGVQPDNLYRSSSPALHHAVWSDSAKLVRLLLRANAHVDATDSDNRTPLTYAIDSHSPKEVINSLIEYKAKTDHRLSLKGLRGYCATGSYIDAKNYLQTVTAHFPDTEAELCLTRAVAQGHLKIVELLASANKPSEYYGDRLRDTLLSYDAFRQVNSDGDSLADIARRNGFEELALYLISKGSKFINHAAFHDAVYKRDTKQLVKLLEEAKAKPEVVELLEFKDVNGNTPLHLAADMPYAPNFELLYRNKANPYAQNNNKLTPLQLIFNNPCPGDLTFVASNLLAPHVATILSKSLGNPVLEPEENTIAVVGKIDEIAAYIASYLAGAHLHNHYDKCIDNVPLTRSKHLLHDLYTLKVTAK